MCFGLIVLLVGFSLSFRNVLPVKIMELWNRLISLGFGLFIVSVIALIYFFSHRERVSDLRLDDMGKRAKNMSKRIGKRFNDKNIIDVLGFSNTTRYGHEMPVICVFIAEDLNSGFVAVENIANFDELDKSKLEQRVSGIFSAKLKRYAVVSSELTDGDVYVKFNFEDVQTSHRLVVKNNDMSKFVSSDSHTIILQDDLALRFGFDVHHLGIIARTRSGKTTLAKYMAYVMKLQGWIVEYNSAKLDRVVKTFNGQSDPEQIVMRAEYWVSFMEQRLEDINSAGEETYLDMVDMSDVAIFFDELGNLNAGLESNKKLKARWESAINKLTATGASTGIHIIAISQMATLQGLGLPSLARANISDSVIMLQEAANSGDERRFMMSGFSDLPNRNFKKGQGYARFVGIGSKWATPHFFESPYWRDDV